MTKFASRADPVTGHSTDDKSINLNIVVRTGQLV